jgi:isocitrate lyase
MKDSSKHSEDSIISAVSAESNAFVVDNQQFLHPTNENERLLLIETAIQRWFNSERWEGKIRGYTANDVAKLRSSIDLVTASHYTSKKLYKLLREYQKMGTCSQTYGALDIVQAINMCKYLTSIYVSGWQCSSTSAVTHEPGPDFADYPMNTVPEKVFSLVKAQLLHDRRQNEERSRMTETERNSTPRYDFICPIIADADAGF